MAGVKAKSGGARPGAGRKPRDREAELDAMIARAVDNEAMERVFRMLVARSQSGDMKATALLLSYVYGRPGDMDAMKVKEAVEAELENFYAHLEKHLNAATFKEVSAVISRA
jgi:hypothetical protein